MELSIAQHVFSNYFDDAQVIDYSVVNNGLINKTYKLDTSQGIYILQEINQNVFNEPELALENIKKVSIWLKEHEFNYAFPTPIHFTYKFFNPRTSQANFIYLNRYQRGFKRYA